MSRLILRGATALAILAVVVACGSPAATATPSPSPSGAPTSSVAPPTPSPAGSPVPSAVPTPSDGPSASPVPSLSPAEAALVEELRSDVRVACVPRRTDLPPRAIAGVECHPATPLVAAVGVYAFDDDGPDGEPALATYLERMDDAGVEPGGGDCAAGRAGDRSWPSSLPDEGDAPDSLRPTRFGCFLNENGIANVRLTCYGDIYVGVLGATAALDDLTAWAWKVADGESTDRDPPGLCARPD